MFDILINSLDSHLRNCEKYATTYAERRALFDQAFGMLTMFCVLYPDSEKKASWVWEESYRPKFEKILWG